MNDQPTNNPCPKEACACQQGPKKSSRRDFLLMVGFGLNAVANLQLERLRTMPEGQIFNRITYGFNTMGEYGQQVTVEDRWAIIAYIRALQRSQNAKIDDVPQQMRASLDTLPPPNRGQEIKK